jgi:hypothetical protein
MHAPALDMEMAHGTNAATKRCFLWAASQMVTFQALLMNEGRRHATKVWMKTIMVAVRNLGS